MKLGMVIYSSDAEVVWNAFRLANFSLGKGDEVRAFLLAKGVECQLLDTDKYKVTEQMQSFLDRGGKILACGTCIKSRNQKESELCPISSMADLYDIIRDCDRTVTF